MILFVFEFLTHFPKIFYRIFWHFWIKGRANSSTVACCFCKLLTSDHSQKEIVWIYLEWTSDIRICPVSLQIKVIVNYPSVTANRCCDGFLPCCKSTSSRSSFNTMSPFSSIRFSNSWTIRDCTTSSKTTTTRIMQIDINE